MNIYVMDESLQRIGVIDSYRSIIWTKRYYEPGEFELYLDATADNVGLCQQGRYLYREQDYENGVITSVMMIQYVQMDTSVDTGNTILLQGKDIKSLLYQRVIWNQTVFSASLEDNIRKAVTENIISPSISARRVTNFRLGTKMGGTSTVQAQATGDNLGEWVSEQLQAYEIGYDVTLASGNFVFTLYKGTDRSYDQSTNPYVIFSTEFGNLLSTDYVDNQTEAKNVALVAGEGEGSARRTTTAGATASAGVNRKEIYVDARDISSETEEGTLTDAEYIAQLKTRGEEELTQYTSEKIFEGEVEPSVNFVYGEDYVLGDKVTIVSEYGIEATARIVEIIDSEDETGRTLVPTFTGGA